MAFRRHVTEDKDQPLELAAGRVRILRGKRLRSRAEWLVAPTAFVLGCVGAVVAVLSFTDGIWMVIGLMIAAFFAGHIPEVLTDLRYEKYRREWEIANGPDAEVATMSGDDDEK